MKETLNENDRKNTIKSLKFQKMLLLPLFWSFNPEIDITLLIIGVLDMDRHKAMKRLCLGLIPNGIPAISPMLARIIDIVTDAFKDVCHI